MRHTLQSGWLTNMMVRRHKYRELLNVMQGIIECARTAEPGRQGYTMAAMSESELDAELDKGYQEAVAGLGRKACDVFEDMSRDYGV